MSIKTIKQDELYSRCILRSPLNAISNEIYTYSINEIMKQCDQTAQEDYIFDIERVRLDWTVVDLFWFIGRCSVV